MNTEEIKSKSISLRDENNNWLGQIVITSDGAFMSITEWGNLNYAWRAYSNKDFREFIISINTGYFASKLWQGINYIASSKSTEKACHRFSEKILPALQEALKEDIKNSPNW